MTRITRGTLLTLKVIANYLIFADFEKISCSLPEHSLLTMCIFLIWILCLITDKNFPMDK